MKIGHMTLLLLVASTASAANIKAGDKLQTLSVLHPDGQEIHSINYQLPGPIPVCSDVTVKKVSKESMKFEYFGREYNFVLDRYTKKVDITLQKAAQTYFGPKCDEAKIKSLSKIDQDGITSGRPQVGMTREGVLFAMGRPPFHVNPNLDVPEWVYWRNRFVRTAVQFDDKGVVINIR